MTDSRVLRKLTKKLQSKTSILSDAEVRIVTREMRRVMGRQLFESTQGFGLRMGDVVRWGSLRARCEEERQERGLSLKDVSSELKIPRYRLEAIEKGSRDLLKPDFAHAYFRYLGIETWVKRWARAYPELARRSGITPIPRRGKPKV